MPLFSFWRLSELEKAHGDAATPRHIMPAVYSPPHKGCHAQICHAHVALYAAAILKTTGHWPWSAVKVGQWQCAEHGAPQCSQVTRSRLALSKPINRPIQLAGQAFDSGLIQARDTARAQRKGVSGKLGQPMVTMPRLPAAAAAVLDLPHACANMQVHPATWCDPKKAGLGAVWPDDASPKTPGRTAA